MNTLFDSAIEKLKSHGIQISYQRMRILSYLTQHIIHPTAEDIYLALKEEIPSLSRTTVYNTLNLFVELGIVRILPVDEAEMCYDIELGQHGHFKCTSCGKVYNFSVEIDELKTDGLCGFDIKEKDVIFKGICLNCQNNKED